MTERRFYQWSSGLPFLPALLLPLALQLRESADSEVVRFSATMVSVSGAGALVLAVPYALTIAAMALWYRPARVADYRAVARRAPIYFAMVVGAVLLGAAIIFQARGSLSSVEWASLALGITAGMAMAAAVGYFWVAVSELLRGVLVRRGVIESDPE